MKTTERFIPAGAGNTTGRPTPSARHPVYPRWRGEHPLYLCTQSFTDGLSPLARGTLAKSKNRGMQTRFIPAGAGNTFDRV